MPCSNRQEELMDTWYITIGGQEIETRPAAGRMRDAPC